MNWRILAALGVLTLMMGCPDEQLPEQDISGTLVVPGDAVDDIKDIGIVYVGLYAGWDADTLGYPYPSTGPVVGDARIGDAFPYGGTTVGHYAFACYQALRCQVVTGRFDTFQQIIDRFELVDEEGDTLTEEQMFDDCRYYYGYNSLEEFAFVGETNIDFVENSDGDWEAPWMLRHAVPYDGAVLYAYADNDSSSCDVDNGSRNRQPDAFLFREGTNFNDTLNFPDKYLSPGDFVTGTPAPVSSEQLTDYQLVLDYVR